VLPGTDAALALGLMHVLIAEDLVDADYVARYTLGYDALKTRAAEWTPARVAGVCGHRAGDGDPTGTLNMGRRGRRQSASTTGCSGTQAAATRCARSPACRRWSVPGAIRPAARCCRRRAHTLSPRMRWSGPT
jgi:hypothetical protein